MLTHKRHRCLADRQQWRDENKSRRQAKRLFRSYWDEIPLFRCLGNSTCDGKAGFPWRQTTKDARRDGGLCYAVSWLAACPVLHCCHRNFPSSYYLWVFIERKILAGTTVPSSYLAYYSEDLGLSVHRIVLLLSLLGERRTIYCIVILGWPRDPHCYLCSVFLSFVYPIVLLRRRSYDEASFRTRKATT